MKHGFIQTEPHILLPSQHWSSHSVALLWWFHQSWAVPSCQGLLLCCA